VLRQLLIDVADSLREEGVIDEREAFIDATFASAKGGGEVIGLTKRSKDVKVLAIVDRAGLPLSASTHAANHHEVTLVQLSFDFYMLETKPEHLIGDKAYDSAARPRRGDDRAAPFEPELKTQDRRKLRRYARRWIVERFFARMQWKRRLLARWEYYPANSSSALCSSQHYRSC
jgi:hypothetical protein